MIKITNRFQLYENIIGEERKVEKSSLKDFEILRILSHNKDGFTAKVRALKNNKIYVMKKINNKNNNNRQLVILKDLNHENIIKYITHFEDDDYLYIITEYLDCTNLGSLINQNKALNIIMKEEKLVNIFLKCLSGLAYLHSLGLIHRNINPGNILIDSHGQIKIINFQKAAYENKSFTDHLKIDDNKMCGLVNHGTVMDSSNYIAPELSNNGYDRKVDVYSMGIIFCNLAYFTNSITPDKGNYSKELYNIIKCMTDMNPNNRPSSEVILKQLKKLYIHKYFCYSGITSILSCLEAFDFLKQQFLHSEELLLKNLDKKTRKEDNISFQFIKCITILKQNNISLGDKKEKWILSLYEFREILRKNGFNKYLSKNKEIEPVFILCFLLEKINKELNQNNSRNVEIGCGLNNESENKLEAYNEYYQWYNKIFSSIITENFFGTIKTKIVCDKCKRSRYSFNFFYLLPFNVKLLIQKKHNIKNKLTIYDAFDCQNNDTVILEEKDRIACQKCKNYEKHFQLKIIYNTPKILIIFFDRGPNCKYKNFINFEQNLILNQKFVEQFDKNYKYNLVGVICRIEELDENAKNKKRAKYIPFIIEGDNYFTNYLDDKDQTKYDLNEIKNKGDIINLFYYCKDINSKSDNKNYSQISNNNNNNNNNINQININLLKQIEILNMNDQTKIEDKISVNNNNIQNNEQWNNNLNNNLMNNNNNNINNDSKNMNNMMIYTLNNMNNMMNNMMNNNMNNMINYPNNMNNLNNDMNNNIDNNNLNEMILNNKMINCNQGNNNVSNMMNIQNNNNMMNNNGINNGLMNNWNNQNKY